MVAFFGRLLSLYLKVGRWPSPIVRAGVVLLALVPGLTACYLPDAYEAEIRISGQGDYAMTYRGTLTWVPLFSDIRLGKVSGSEAREKVDGIEADIKRDKYFTTVNPLGQGRFAVAYERQGNVVREDQVTFIRRNEDLLTVKSIGRTIEITAKTLSDEQERQLTEVGLQSSGLLRVVTGARVLSHNAQRVTEGPGYRVFDWRLTNASRQAPKLVLGLSGS